MKKQNKSFFKMSYLNFKIVLRRTALLFQSLSFIKGSNQGIHQDTAYVVTDQPMKLIATWIALEDINPGSGVGVLPTITSV